MIGKGWFVRSWVGGLLRRWADRIDYKGAPRAIGWSFTFDRGKGIVFHDSHDKGCSLWRLGDLDYDKAYSGAADRPARVLWENLAEGRRPFVEHPPAQGQKLNAAGAAAIPVVTSSTPPSPPPPPSGVGYARGGVIRGPSDRADDSIPFMLSDGHAWIPAAAVKRYGEELLREIGGVDHVHPLDAPEHPSGERS